MILARNIFLIAAMLALFAGCDRSNSPVNQNEPTDAKSTDLPPESAPVPTPPSDRTCEEGDIECDERMYQLEETLFAYESAMSTQLHPEARSCWQTDIASFRTRIDACSDFACKESALLMRIASLHDMQPMEQRATLQLPYVPALIAVLPPSVESDDTGASDEARMEVQGSLVHATEDPEHMGVAVQANGNDHVFIFEMDMSNDLGQDEVLGLLGTSPTTRVLVRGVGQAAPTGVSNFDPAHCRWVYQLTDSDAQ